MNRSDQSSIFLMNNTILFVSVVFFFVLFFCRATSSQVILAEKEKTVQIGHITVQGNEKTKREIIVRELEFKSGDLVSIERLDAARKRVENLNLFNRVIFNFKDAGETKDLIILVWERWYIYPTPLFNVNDHDWHKLSYGFALFHANFRGRAEHLWLAGWLGYNPGLNFSYSNRWFGGRHRFYSTISVRSQRIAGKTLLHPDLNEHHRSASILFGKKYGIYWYTDVELTMKLIEADERIAWQTNDRRDRVFSTAFKIQHDTRDLWEYPHKGHRILFSFSRSSLLNGSANYGKWQLDWREYRTIFGIILTGRFLGEITQRKLPIYEHLYVGYDERIRGYFDTIREGENRLLTSVELRFPILREKYFQVPTDSWMAPYFQHLKLGIYFTFFRDAGAVWYQSEKLHPRHWLAGTGVGLNFVMPYSNIVRLEYAFDENGRSETIIDVNVAF